MPKSYLEFVLKELHHKPGGKFHLILSLFHVAVGSQLLYTGIVIYAPALILNQGEHEWQQTSINTFSSHRCLMI